MKASSIMFSTEVELKSKSKALDENLNTDILRVFGGREWIELDTLVFLLTARLALSSLWVVVLKSLFVCSWKIVSLTESNLAKFLHPSKDILYKSGGELSLFVQCATCTFGRAQSCHFKKLKVYEMQLTIYNIIFTSVINLNVSQNTVIKNTRNSWTLNFPMGLNKPRFKGLILYFFCNVMPDFFI